MNRNTLAGAYARRTAQPAAVAQELGAASARTLLAEPAPVTRPAPAPGRVAREAAVIEDALLIAVRRSLASCKDSSQLRMLAAFQASR
jgi:hypothetical protein